MTLRNAFEDLGTEGMLRRILRAVTFPRDTADRQIITVSGNPQVNVLAGGTSTALSGQFNAPNSVTAWNAHDIREEYREFSHQSFQVARSRWTIS